MSLEVTRKPEPTIRASPTAGACEHPPKSSLRRNRWRESTLPRPSTTKVSRTNPAFRRLSRSKYRHLRARESNKPSILSKPRWSKLEFEKWHRSWCSWFFWGDGRWCTGDQSRGTSTAPLACPSSLFPLMKDFEVPLLNKKCIVYTTAAEFVHLWQPIDHRNLDLRHPAAHKVFM